MEETYKNSERNYLQISAKYGKIVMRLKIA